MSKIKCLLCNDIIESKHRHDFNQCKCGKVSIDGGNEYLRVGYSNTPNDVEIIEDINPDKVVKFSDLTKEQQTLQYIELWKALEDFEKPEPNRDLKDLMKDEAIDETPKDSFYKTGCLIDEIRDHGFWEKGKDEKDFEFNNRIMELNTRFKMSVWARDMIKELKDILAEISKGG